MKILQGFKTISFNIVGILAAWLTTRFDISLPEEHQTAISTTMIAAGNIALRLMTKTPVGKKESKEQNYKKVQK